MIPLALRKWLAFGSGVGIHITGPRGSESLRIAAVRVRPGSGSAAAMVRGQFTIEDFPHQPAGVWGTDYAAFVRKLGMRHVPAVVVLPRQEVITRVLSLPGVSDKDLESAVHFQLDGLHPYNEDDVISSWARLPGTSSVLVAVARRDVIDRYAVPFDEAGIKVGGFTSSPAAIYSALRVFGARPPQDLLAFDESGGTLEFYGESAARPVFSASFNGDLARAAALAAAELRADPQIEAKPLSALLGTEPPLSYAAALASACPRFTIPLNLLPADRRQTASPLRWVPSAALGAIAILLAGALAGLPGFESRKYLESLNGQIAAVSPLADRAQQIDKEVDATRRRIQLLDDVRRRPKADMDVLAELTRLLPPPVWLNSAEVSSRQVVVGGEADQAAPLLRMLDASPMFESSEFQMLTRIPTGEMFRIRAMREGTVPLDNAKGRP